MLGHSSALRDPGSPLSSVCMHMHRAYTLASLSQSWQFSTPFPLPVNDSVMGTGQWDPVLWGASGKFSSFLKRDSQSDIYSSFLILHMIMWGTTIVTLCSFRGKLESKCWQAEDGRIPRLWSQPRKYPTTTSVLGEIMVFSSIHTIFYSFFSYLHQKYPNQYFG